MSTPSFIDRLRSRSRRPEQVTLLEATLPPVLETSPGPLPDLAVLPAAPLVAIQAELPEDHWHAGDPRMLPGGTVVLAGDVPSPRRPVDRRGLHLVPEVDLRGEVLDLRAAAAGAPPALVDVVDEAVAAPAAPDTPEREAPCTEPSTWLG